MKRTRWFLVGAVSGVYFSRWLNTQLKQAPRRAAGMARSKGVDAARRAGETAGLWIGQFNQGLKGSYNEATTTASATTPSRPTARTE